jgi:DNA-binding transcriptional LysR family regulator
MNAADLSRLDLNLLVLFQVVLEERHVGRAAARLSLTPSAVSHGLGRLRSLLRDPLFLRTPKGVVPSARAQELAAPVDDILARVSRVVASSKPFDPATSARRFSIGAPDAISVVILPELLADLRRSGPHVGVSMRHVSPQHALAELEARAVDIVITPLDDIPVRFAARIIGEDDFVVVARQGHPFLKAPTLDRYCEAQHVLASASGDAKGFVDLALERRGRTRRIAVVVPDFMSALATLAGTSLLAALPRSLVRAHGPRFGLASAAPPLPLPMFPLRAVVPQAALMDAGVTWLLDGIARAASALRGTGAERVGGRTRKRSARRRTRRA